jgi:hypothetical protein
LIFLKKKNLVRKKIEYFIFSQIDNKIRNSFFQTSNIEKLKVENIERPLEELYLIQKSYNVSKIIFLIFWDLNHINTNKLNNYGWEYTSIKEIFKTYGDPSKFVVSKYELHLNSTANQIIASNLANFICKG